MGFLDAQYSCSECDFRIGVEKFEKIAYGSKLKDFTNDEDNLSALNNLGHDLVTEDFSDSPHRR